MGMAYKANRVIQLSKNIGSNKLWLLRLETTFHELLNNLGMLRKLHFSLPSASHILFYAFIAINVGTCKAQLIIWSLYYMCFLKHSLWACGAHSTNRNIHCGPVT